MPLDSQVKVSGREQDVGLKLEGEFGARDINVGTLCVEMVQFKFLHFLFPAEFKLE